MNFKTALMFLICSAVVACAKSGDENVHETSFPGSQPQASAQNSPQESVQSTTVPLAPQSQPVTNVTPTSPAAPAAETSTAPHESAPPPVAESTPAFQPPPMDDDFQLDVATAERIPLPRARPRPQPVAAPAAPAVAEMNPLEKELLNSINRSRAQAGVAPLKFSRLQSSGSSKCLGSEGHSVHMGQTRKMSHDQFPQDICVRTSASGENVGYASGAQVQAVRTVHKMMMDEGPGGGHYQNIMSSHYNTLGVGFYYSNNVLWVTESFLRL